MKTFSQMQVEIEAIVGPLKWDAKARRIEAANWEFLIVEEDICADEEGQYGWGGVEMFGDSFNLALVGLYNRMFSEGVQIIRGRQRPPQIVIDAAAKIGKQISVSGDCIPYLGVSL